MPSHLCPVPASLRKLLPLGGLVLAVAGNSPRTVARAAGSTDRVYLPTALASARLRLTPAGLNDAGQVVGRIDGYGAPITRPFRWQNGQTEVLPAGSASVVVASAINSSGLVAGSADAVSTQQWHPLFWRSGLLVDLGFLTPSPAGAPLGLFDLNDQEQAVGGSGHAFLLQGDTMADLGTLGGPTSVAYALNEQGQVVGSAELSSGSPHAFLWKNGAMQDLGTLGGDASIAYDINESGQVVGTSTLASGVWHAFLWEDGSMRDLGALPGHALSVAQAINDRGEVVGYSRRSAADLASSTGVIWADGSLRSLSTGVRDRALWRITDARDINNRGQIVGQAVHLGSATGVMLSPAANDLSASWTRVNVKYRGLRAPRITLQGDLLVRNGGPRTVGPVTMAFYLSHDDQLDAGDLPVAKKVVSLPPTGQMTLQFRKPLSRGQVVAGLRLIAAVDADHVYSEEDETNNTIVSSPLP